MQQQIYSQDNFAIPKKRKREDLAISDQKNIFVLWISSFITYVNIEKNKCLLRQHISSK